MLRMISKSRTVPSLFGLVLTTYQRFSLKLVIPRGVAAALLNTPSFYYNPSVIKWRINLLSWGLKEQSPLHAYGTSYSVGLHPEKLPTLQKCKALPFRQSAAEKPS